MTNDQIRSHVEAGAWHRAGWHTLAITSTEPTGRGLLWRALWESGSRSVLDGASALIAVGLKGWSEASVHVSVPNDARVRSTPGVRHHRPRVVGEVFTAGLRRTKPHVAAIRAALWARSDREAATLIAMTIQHRDVCHGAESMGELDLARLCREAGLPAPTRQAVRTAPGGKVYLDAWWDDAGVHVEVQGAHHYQGIAVVDDALRANEVVIAEDATSLQIPVLALRLEPARCMDQLTRALTAGRQRRGAA